MHRWLLVSFGVATLGACSLLASFDGLTSDTDGGVTSADRDGAIATQDAMSSEGTDATDEGDASDGTDAGTSHVTILQHHVCTYKTVADTFTCALPLANVAGDALLVHVYYNYSDSTIVAGALTDSASNTYSFLDVGDVNCPAGALPDHVCCTTTLNNGTCQGWAIATNAPAPKNPVTITFAISSPTTTSDVMGADVFEISGLANSPLDQASAAAMAVGTSVVTPTITTTTPGELVVAGIAFYTSTSTMTPAAGWSIDQDPGYFSASIFQIGGLAGSTYGGSSMGSVTGMTKPGTATIVALKGR